MTAAAVRFLDHTADVGIDVTAPSLPDLFDRAAGGMLALLRGDDDAPRESPPAEPSPAGPDQELESQELALSAAGAAELLAAWLRELLFLHEVRRRDWVHTRFVQLSENGLEARVATRPALPAVREIKGVTYHELDVTRHPDGWAARVIFDV